MLICNQVSQEIAASIFTDKDIELDWESVKTVSFYQLIIL
jgi:hypothetical protein